MSAAALPPPSSSALLTPAAVMDDAIGTRILVLMKNNKELEGTLVGVDEFVNVVLEDVVEFDATENGTKEVGRRAQLLLNGANIAMLVPRKV